MLYRPRSALGSEDLGRLGGQGCAYSTATDFESNGLLGGALVSLLKVLGHALAVRYEILGGIQIVGASRPIHH